MREEYKGKSADELRAALEQCIENYPSKPWEKKKELLGILCKRKGVKMEEYVGAYETLKGKHITFDERRICIPYSLSVYNYKLGTYEHGEPRAYTNIWCDITFEKDGTPDFANFTDSLKRAVYGFAFNYRREASVGYMKELLDDIDSILSQAEDESFLCAIRELGREIDEITSHWSRTKNRITDLIYEPEALASAMRDAWLVENPLESFIGKEVWITSSRRYARLLEVIDPDWVKVEGGRVKKVNVDRSYPVFGHCDGWGSKLTEKAWDIVHRIV